VAGLAATVHASRGPDRTFSAPEFRDFATSPGMTDRQVADAVYRELQPPLSNPLPNFAIKRNSQGQLELDFYSVNGMQRATVLENERKLRIEKRHVDVWQYVNNLHTTTPGGRHEAAALRLWSYYVEFSIWSLILMSISG